MPGPSRSRVREWAVPDMNNQYAKNHVGNPVHTRIYIYIYSAQYIHIHIWYIINLPFRDGLYHPFVVILGMVCYWVYHMSGDGSTSRNWGDLKPIGSNRRCLEPLGQIHIQTIKIPRCFNVVRAEEASP